MTDDTTFGRLHAAPGRAEGKKIDTWRFAPAQGSSIEVTVHLREKPGRRIEDPRSLVFVASCASDLASFTLTHPDINALRGMVETTLQAAIAAALFTDWKPGFVVRTSLNEDDERPNRPRRTSISLETHAAMLGPDTRANDGARETLHDGKRITVRPVSLAQSRDAAWIEDRKTSMTGPGAETSANQSSAEALARSMRIRVAPDQSVRLVEEVASETPDDDDAVSSSVENLPTHAAAIDRLHRMLSAFGEELACRLGPDAPGGVPDGRDLITLMASAIARVEGEG